MLHRDSVFLDCPREIVRTVRVRPAAPCPKVHFRITRRDQRIVSFRGCVFFKCQYWAIDVRQKRIALMEPDRGDYFSAVFDGQVFLLRKNGPEIHDLRSMCIDNFDRIAGRKRESEAATAAQRISRCALSARLIIRVHFLLSSSILCAFGWAASGDAECFLAVRIRSLAVRIRGAKLATRLALRPLALLLTGRISFVYFTYMNIKCNNAVQESSGLILIGDKVQAGWSAHKCATHRESGEC